MLNEKQIDLAYLPFELQKEHKKTINLIKLFFQCSLAFKHELTSYWHSYSPSVGSFDNFYFDLYF